ncbi:hypothetical protein DID88_002440 [Monilinia fructigena]|uniref:Uncharacterized protein n=1 Tax=Monilinia fructigena TaxID=38457 RepID=A0A395IP85_9HELO|nr:hypothetical protein DID88_002440 [Monilinia fructigena]
MAPYDSDSSGGEEEDYTETNVLLGYAGKEAQDDTISYLGGEPTWIDPTTLHLRPSRNAKSAMTLWS